MLKDRVKHVMFRAMRPGLLEVNERLERLEAVLGAPARPVAAPAWFPSSPISPGQILVPSGT